LEKGKKDVRNITAQKTREIIFKMTDDEVLLLRYYLSASFLFDDGDYFNTVSAEAAAGNAMAKKAKVIVNKIINLGR
jgi:hypothetical protein